MAWRILAFFSLAFVLSACKTSGDGSNVASEEGKPAAGRAALALDDLKNKSADELYSLFRTGSGEGEIPLGHASGFPVLMAEASTLNTLAGKLWGGKEFKKETAPSGGEIVTLKSFVGPMTAARAKVVSGRISDVRPTLLDSTVDDKTSIVLNYGDADMGTVTPFNKIVDEIRLINPEKKLYLGRAFMADSFVCYFALQFTD